MSWPRQAFRLSREIVEATSKEEVAATIADMKALSICHAPFEQMDILIQERELFKLYKSPASSSEEFEEERRRLELSTNEVIFRYDGQRREERRLVQVLMKGCRHDWVDMVSFINACELELGREPDWDLNKAAHEVGLELLDILIVLLATKNVVKEIKECKLVKLGIGSKNRHQYTTTLKIGAVTQRTDTDISDEADHALGIKRRPHLRRGHIRRQRHGPNFELTKQVWIEPIFVNADPNWIAERTAYNVSLARPQTAKEQADA